MPSSLRDVDVAALRDFSQNGEQALVAAFLQQAEGTYSPFFVDAGAYDGVTGSNTRFLALHGWPGIAIEPNPDAFERLRSLYATDPAVRCVRCAVSDHAASDVEMMIADGPEGTAADERWRYSQVSTLNPWFAEEFVARHGYRYRPIRVDVLPLAAVLDANGCPPDFGLLCVDCEGEDHRILQGFDFARYRPRLLCTESDDRNRALFAELLRPHGYRVVAHTASNTFFALVSAG